MQVGDKKKVFCLWFLDHTLTLTLTLSNLSSLILDPIRTLGLPFPRSMQCLKGFYIFSNMDSGTLVSGLKPKYLSPCQTYCMFTIHPVYSRRSRSPRFRVQSLIIPTPICICSVFSLTTLSHTSSYRSYRHVTLGRGSVLYDIRPLVTSVTSGRVHPVLSSFLYDNRGGEENIYNRLYMCVIYNTKSFCSPFLVLFLPRETEKNERRGLFQRRCMSLLGCSDSSDLTIL